MKSPLAKGTQDVLPVTPSVSQVSVQEPAQSQSQSQSEVVPSSSQGSATKKRKRAPRAAKAARLSAGSAAVEGSNLPAGIESESQSQVQGSEVVGSQDAQVGEEVKMDVDEVVRMITIKRTQYFQRIIPDLCCVYRFLNYKPRQRCNRHKRHSPYP